MASALFFGNFGLLFYGIYILVDTYMIFLERGRECGVPEKVRDFLGCF